MGVCVGLLLCCVVAVLIRWLVVLCCVVELSLWCCSALFHCCGVSFFCFLICCFDGMFFVAVLLFCCFAVLLVCCFVALLSWRVDGVLCCRCIETSCCMLLW